MIARFAKGSKARVLGLALLCIFMSRIGVPAAPAERSIISVGSDGRLVYDSDAQGNRVPDFSHCGYAGGELPIPETVPVRIFVKPTPGDATARIQKAIDHVGSLPTATNGFRGAVLLSKGRHEVFGRLRLNHSGVVLRGEGMGPDGTVLIAAGQDRSTLIRIAGEPAPTNVVDASWEIADRYVPVGATRFRLPSGATLRPGNAIRIIRPSTMA